MRELPERDDIIAIVDDDSRFGRSKAVDPVCGMEGRNLRIRAYLRAQLWSLERVG